MKFSVADNIFNGIINKVPFFHSKDSMFLAYFMTMLEPLELMVNKFSNKYFSKVILYIKKVNKQTWYIS